MGQRGTLAMGNADQHSPIVSLAPLPALPRCPITALSPSEGRLAIVLLSEVMDASAQQAHGPPAGVGLGEQRDGALDDRRPRRSWPRRCCCA